MTTSIHPAYAAIAPTLGLPLSADSLAYRSWVVGMLAEWRYSVGKDPGEAMTYADHAAFAAWMDRAS